MGSRSDQPVVNKAIEVLTSLEIPHEVRVISAHRSPQLLDKYVHTAEKNGCEVFIAAAGMAAHLAGAIAARTVKPVIGIPVDSTLNGWDALLSTVQMPPGVPVATVSIGVAGSQNAAHLAAQIIALKDSALNKRLNDLRRETAERLSAQSAL